MLMGTLSGGFLCGLLDGCVVVPAVGFLGAVLRGGCWWPGSSGPLCLLLIAGGGAVDCGSLHFAHLCSLDRISLAKGVEVGLVIRHIFGRSEHEAGRSCPEMVCKVCKKLF